MAASELIKYKIVQWVRTPLPKRYVKIKFITGITEWYHYAEEGPHRWRHWHLIPENMLIGDVPKIYHSYESDPLDPEAQKSLAHNITIRVEDWKKASFLARRVVIHQFVAMGLRDRYIPAKHPDWVILNDLKLLKAIRLDCVKRGIFNFRKLSLRNPGKYRLIEQFFDLNLDGSPFGTLYYVDHTKHPRTPMNTYYLRRGMRWSARQRTFNPHTYAEFLRRMKVTSVIDLHPDMGHKAIACAIANVHYITPRTKAMETAISRGLVDLLGLSHEWLGDQSADLLISDNNFNGFDISGTEPYLPKVKQMIAFSHAEERLEHQGLYKPSQAIRVVTVPLYCSNLKNYDYILVW